jgi:DNA-binding SARP family transcriptional activator
MRFALLGPLLVDDGAGDLVTLSGPRLRVLLAALLLQANVPVSAEALAEAVWDGEPPPGAAETLRSYVRRLRRVLGPEAGARIVARSPGYLVRVEPAELDVVEFEASCTDASAALRKRAWAEASAAAARALLLWRGAPLLDVASQMLHAEFVPRLGQMRVQALEDRAEADLWLGHDDRLVPRLRDLTAQYPMRERFHVQLMLALARTGRRAEALDAYRQARRVLAEELGIDPGAELRQLQERILAGDASLITAPTAPEAAHPAPAAASIPRQLPAAVRSFVGRQAESGMLHDLAGQGGEGGEAAGSGGVVVISAINGMAGVGKTALAVHAAHRRAGEFPDGQLFIDMHGYTQGHEPRAAGEALEWFLRALGVPPQQVPPGTEERAALFRQRLAGTRTLIVLDNAASEAHVRPLLPGSAGCLVLVTSRRRLKGLDDAHVLALDVLPPADAMALVRAVAGPGRVPTDDPVLSEIAGLCGHLPLALRIAAALLRHRPAWTPEYLAGMLRVQQRRISTLSDGERDLGAAFDLSYHSLTSAQQQMFRCLGLIPGTDFDAYAAAALTGADPAAAARLLEDLVDHNLLIQHAPDRYRLHDLIRLHARTLAERDPAADRDAALGWLLDYYQHIAGQRPDPARGPARICRRLSGHRP